jgi:hypothetical protein
MRRHLKAGFKCQGIKGYTKSRPHMRIFQMKSQLKSTITGGIFGITSKMLYAAFKISTARFYKHLTQSLLRLGVEKTKHDPDLWMIYKYHIMST